MKFETPKIDIYVFSENIVTVVSGGIENKATVKAAKDFLASEYDIDKTNNILTFTLN